MGKAILNPRSTGKTKRASGAFIPLGFYVREVLSHVDISKEDLDPKLKDAANLLAKIVS